MKSLLKIVGLVILAFVALLGAILVEAHVEIRGIDPALPDLSELREPTRVDDGPQRIHFLNTASQSSPDVVVAHPSFVLEWADGRIFLIDAGMDEAGARAFGEPLEALLGADPIQPLGSVATRLGPALDRVQGVGFTHLHIDHTGGLVPLCQALNRPLAIYQTPWQADRGNYSTTGDAHIEQAGCAQRERLEDATMYSLFIVPESPARLERMRLWLSALDAESDVTVLVSHDQDALEASLPAWTTP